MKKTMFIVPHGTYKFDVMVCIGTTDETLHKELHRRGVKLTQEDKEILKLRGDGRTVMLDGGQTVIRVRPQKNKAAFRGSLAHEIFHAVEFLFSRIGIQHDFEKSGEAFAYQIGHLTEQIYAQLS